MMQGIIDPPSPFASASEWRDFAAQMEALSPDNPEAAAYLAEARKRAISDLQTGETDE